MVGGSEVVGRQEGAEDQLLERGRLGGTATLRQSVDTEGLAEGGIG